VAAGDQHLHVHFADTAALDALRLGRLLGLSFSLTAHAYDVFQRPRNLREKLDRAALVAGESEYVTRHLRELVGEEHAGKVHHVPAGVDAEHFRRDTPYPGGRTLVAVGRLIEKKGFAYLLEAAALLAREQPLDAVHILGDGPLRQDLEWRAGELGIGQNVEFLGAGTHDDVRRLLERADVLAMPSIVAADGDRDSMPNVVYEALAMQVPVVASDEVGLPEVVAPGWGRLAPPADAAALAAAIAELLGRPAEERVAMGRAGREFVMRERSWQGVADRLAALIANHSTGVR
jgi:glycosyltransferase involved in cell wall biosynthesis